MYPTGKRKRKSKTKFTAKADIDDVEAEISSNLVDRTMQVKDR
jgi:hypothetical protein